MVKSHNNPVSIVVAVKREADAVLEAVSVDKTEETDGHRFYLCSCGKDRLVLAVVGMGLEKAKSGAAVLIRQYAPSAMISVGFAGAAAPGLSRGEIILGDQLFYEDNSGRLFDPDFLLLDTAEKAIRETGVRYKKGRLMTVSSPVCTQREKKTLGSRFNCLAVEMESSALAEAAYNNGIPFLCIRTILDRAEDNLRLSPQSISRDGRLSIFRSMKTLATNPLLIPDFIGLRSSWAAARKSIGMVVPAVLSGIHEIREKDSEVNN